MKQLRLLLVGVVGTLLLQQAHADPFRESQFVGYVTGNLGSTSASGGAEGWENPNLNVTVTNGSGSLDGTSLGLVASDGDMVWMSGTYNLSARNLFAAGGTFPQTTDTNLYFSFLYRFNAVTNVSANGQFIIQVNRANSGTGTPQHWDLLAKRVGSQVQLGIMKAGAPNNATNYAATLVNESQTFFVVVRQHIIPGAQNDVYDLWINPPANTFFTNETDVPLPDATVGALTTDGTEDSSGTGPGRFVVASGANANFDEFRVGGTWADVTPFFGQCIPAGVNANPLSQTNSSELAFTFSVTKRGTSAAYQWQLSTNGGTVWNDIQGANASILTTPNLFLPADNGNKYRAIISVACNGSSATSSVATVTLTTPTPTPAGLIMDDTFLDPTNSFDDRVNLPVWQSNSVWFTATTDNLVVFNQGGNMVGTPLDGASSLWLGYFTDFTNALPVHLAVGRAIKVTLPFTPGSYNLFTNNAGLRIGLFDYFDGGTRVVADGATAGGSAGSGINVRGYMLNLDFGPTFSANSPMQLLTRANLSDANLMGSISDYVSLGSGPAGGGFTNQTAFQAGTQYTLEFTVARISQNAVTVTADIITPTTNWLWSVTETNAAYHRFDAIAIRPNSIQTSADSFTFPEFIVEVKDVVVTPQSITINSVSHTGNNVDLSWTPSPAGPYTFTVQRKLDLTDATWTTLATGLSGTTYTDTTATGNTGYYRVVSP